MPEHEKLVLEALRNLDAERYLACLYLPPQLRVAASAIYAFDAEIARIPALVSEPMPGEIRLQWWRDQIAQQQGSGPVGELLEGAITKHNLPREVFAASLDARIFDLYHDPMPDQGSFEGYLGETVSVWFQMVALCAGADRSEALADACGHSGMALGIMRLIARLPDDRSAGRIYFPLGLLAQNKLDRDSWLAGAPGDSHGRVLEEMLDQAEIHVSKARKAIAGLPRNIRLVFLPLTFQAPLIAKAKTRGIAVLTQPLKQHPLHRQFLALKAALLRTA